MVRQRTLWTLVASGTVTGLLAHQTVSFERSADLYGTPATRQAAPWARTALETLPLRLLSRALGAVSRVYLPKATRRTLLSTYCACLPACQLDDIRDPLETFPTLAAFQQRQLKPSARPIDSKASLVAPCDGRLLSCGQVESGALLQPTKGIRLSMRALLDSTDERDPLVRGPIMVEVATTETLGLSRTRGSTELNSKTMSMKSNHTAIQPDTEAKALYYAVFHLPAGGYHRFHSPARWDIELRRHVVGQLLPGTPRILRRLGSLFTVNERVCLVGEWTDGFFGMVAVAAFGNGDIYLHFDEDLVTNCHEYPLNYRRDMTYRWPVRLQPGDEMGGFRQGSCIVLLFEAAAMVRDDSTSGHTGRDVGFLVQPGALVRTGEALFRAP
jgi:phosphatidylserine decarboxylase